MARILVVEADEGVRSLIADVLANAGHEVHSAASGDEVLARLDGSTFDLIVSDLTMPAVEGIGLYWEIAMRWPQLVSRVVYVTGTVQAESTDYRLLLADKVPFVMKPFQPEHLLDVVTRALARRAP